MTVFKQPGKRKELWGIRRWYPLGECLCLGWTCNCRYWAEVIPLTGGLSVVCWDNLRGKKDRDLFIPFPLPRDERSIVMAFLDTFYRDMGSADGKNGKPAAHGEDPEFRKEYPCLFEFLTVSVVSGKPREVGTLFVFCEAGLVKGCLTDRHSSRTLWESSESFYGLLEALERGLASGSRTAWRVKKEFKGKK